MQPLYLQYMQIGTPGIYELSFSKSLHHRSSDFTLYQNDWNKAVNSDIQDTDDLFSEHDTELLKVIVTRLMQDDACITVITVHNSALDIKKSIAVSIGYIVEIVSEACLKAGYEVVIDKRPASGNARLIAKTWLARTFGASA
jgi:hypothetical protein